MSSIRIAVLISGGGSTLKNLLEREKAGLLRASIVLVVSSKSDAGGIDIARSAGIPVRVLERKQFNSTDDFSSAIFDQLRAYRCDLVVLGGFLKLISIPDDFVNRVINIHPSLIPRHCGKGFYGLRVHRSVLESGDKNSGCTIHFVDNDYDHGPIISQKTVEVLQDDTPETLAARVFAAECEEYPQVINELASRLESNT
ncbi:MAG TPA: phosphoribosylglycinamide formyltransferase [Pirellulaceae bacterium]|nr:phosphoribosylglycinamide formyltransferase [Pirellulaceae bacterium]HMO92140.1 phosphoribosylglycinamide formyltransferase [Pirellulaceae bacterium]HMP68935.1 phosphoribosylglycinamide formyltransferase [Pirellulaceae bacterium]